MTLDTSTRELVQLFPDKPVILVTGCGLLLEPDQVDAGAVDAILTKPFTLHDLSMILINLSPGAQPPRHLAN